MLDHSEVDERLIPLLFVILMNNLIGTNSVSPSNLFRGQHLKVFTKAGTTEV